MSDHTHACTRCAASYDCYGTYSRNYDGFPEAVCSAYHEQQMTECEVCEETVWCGDCGEVPAVADSDYCHECRCAQGEDEYGN